MKLAFSLIYYVISKDFFAFTGITFTAELSVLDLPYRSGFKHQLMCQDVTV